MKASSTIKYFSIIVFLFALVIGFVTRFIPLYSYNEFKFDQARDAYIVSEIIGGDLPLEGPVASIVDFSLPPHYYYLIAPMGLVSLEPEFMVVPNAIFSFFSIPLLFIFISRFVGIGNGNLKYLLSAVSVLVWSFFIPDIALANRVWNPGPIPFFLLIYLILMSNLENKLQQGGKGLAVSILLGVVITILSSLHAVTLALIPASTVLVFYWKYIQNNFSQDRIRAYLICILTSIILFVPYFFSSQSIFYLLFVKYGYLEFIVNQYFVFIVILLSSGFVYINYKYRNLLSSENFRYWFLNVIQTVFISIFLIFTLINYSESGFYLQKLFTDGYLLTHNEDIQQIIGLATPFLILFLIPGIKNNIFPLKIYLLITLTFLIITQFFTELHYIHYSSIIWLSPFLLTINRIKDLRGYLRGVLTAIFIMFCIVSIYFNQNYLKRYLLEDTFGETRALNVEDMKQALKEVPEDSTISLEGQEEYNLAYQYLAEKIINKNFKFTLECYEVCYTIYPKYVKGSLYSMRAGEQPQGDEYKLFVEGKRYYIYKY